MPEQSQKTRFVRDLRELIACQRRIAQAEATLLDGEGKYQYSRAGIQMVIPTREGDSDEELLLPLAENPGFRQLGAGVGTQSAAAVASSPRTNPMAGRWVPALATICLLCGLFFAFVGAKASAAPTPSDQAAVVQPVVQPAAPTPTLGLAHAGFYAPDTLSFKSGGFSGQWPVVSYAEDQGRVTLFDGRGGPNLSGLIHYGAYPGEPGNMVLAGNEATFAQSPPQRLTINDTVDVKDKAGQTFSYQIVPCDPATGRKECRTSGFDEWVAGRTPVERFLYLKSPGNVVEEEVACELTIIIALNPPADQGGIGPAPTPDPQQYQNYILRGVLVGNKLSQQPRPKHVKGAYPCNPYPIYPTSSSLHWQRCCRCWQASSIRSRMQFSAFFRPSSTITLSPPA